MRLKSLGALVAAVLLGLAGGFFAGRAVAEDEPSPRRPATTAPSVDVGSMPDVEAAQADVIHAALAAFQLARDEAGAVLAPFGWTPELCEPAIEGVPMLTDRPCVIVPSIAHWLAINRCEQGGDWHAYGRFGNGLMGGGGLGISDGAWLAWGGAEFAPTAAAASPFAQMIVASRGYARYGGSPWSCRA